MNISSKNKTNKQNRLSTLEKAFKILEYLEINREKTRLSDIAHYFKIPYATTFNILKTLAKHKFIECEESSKQYQLGFKLFQMGNHVQYIRDLREVSLPFMRELTRESGETSHLGILMDLSLYFLEIIESPLANKTRAIVGSSLPLHAPAVGKTLLAFQPEEERNKIVSSIDLTRFTPHTIIDRGKLIQELNLINDRGYAVDNEEVFLGTTCIAAPIFSSFKKIVAALGITGDTKRINQNKPTLIELVQHEALNVSFQLGYQNKVN